MLPRKAPRLFGSSICARTTTNICLKSSSICIRQAHIRVAQPIPAPTPFVPDAPTFLTLIGRNMISHSSKLPTWEALFSLSSEELRAAGLEPARSRRYLLRWRQKFRNGEFGIGGDLKEVKDGTGELRIVEINDESRKGASLLKKPGRRRVIINVKPDASPDEVERIRTQVQEGKVSPPSEIRIKRYNVIAGKNVKLLKGEGRAQLQVQEGLWEHRRGKKVDGGERRKAAVRAKRRAAERKDT